MQYNNRFCYNSIYHIGYPILIKKKWIKALQSAHKEQVHNAREVKVKEGKIEASRVNRKSIPPPSIPTIYTSDEKFPRKFSNPFTRITYFSHPETSRSRILRNKNNNKLSFLEEEKTIFHISNGISTSMAVAPPA